MFFQDSLLVKRSLQLKKTKQPCSLSATQNGEWTQNGEGAKNDRPGCVWLDGKEKKERQPYLRLNYFTLFIPSCSCFGLQPLSAS